MPIHVDVAEEAPLRKSLPLHGALGVLLEKRLADAVDRGAVIVIRLVAHLGRSGNIGGHAGEVLGVFVHQFIEILHIHVTGAAGTPAIGHDLNQIGAHFFKLAVHHIGHAVAERQNHDHGADTDDDTQHGEKRPHLAGFQRFQRQLEGLGKVHTPTSPSAPVSSGCTTAAGSEASPS